MMAEVDAGATIEIRDGSDDTNANLIKVIFILIFLLISINFNSFFYSFLLILTHFLLIRS